MLVAMGLAAWQLPGSASVAPSPTEPPSRILRGPAILLIVASTVAYVALGGIYAFTERIAQALQIPVTTYGAPLAISTLGGAIGSTLGGWFGTRMGWTYRWSAGCR